ncbi:MAG TPA: clostripain-related cysteine peptidase [Anaerolineales bacterium]|nr:clostripain-related cysteine peptidase [Anaerolineales bacterium]
MRNSNSKWMVPSILAVIALCLACVCCGLLGLYFFGDQILAGLGGPQAQPTTEIPVTEATVTPEPVTTTQLPEWTVIVYSAADDEVLEENMWFDVNEMELVGSNPQLNIVVQIDRYGGAFTGDGDWSDTRRYLITQDTDLNHIASPVLESLGELDTGDPQTLIDFVTWAVENYPAKKYALIMSDHGGGWTGGFSDMTTASYSDLTIPEIADSLEQVLQNTGLDKFEMLGFDACLMGQIEVFASLYPYSNYMIASEEVVPSYGWSYAAWLGDLAQNPAVDGSAISQSIVSTYVIDETLFTVARSSADEISQEEATTTLSAVESARIPDVVGAMNGFITTITSLDQELVAEARTYTRNYFSPFGEDVSPSYIDLGNFSEVMTTLTDDPDTQQAAIQLQTAISSAVVAEKHGPSMSGSNGIAFHFPDSDLYYFTEFNDDFPPYYAESSQSFLQQSVWDEFLAYHYTGEEFAPQEGEATTPVRSAQVVGPGASEMTVGPIQISDLEITGDETVTVSTTVEGNVSYIHTALYFWDPASESYWIGDVSYFIAENTATVDGVNVPDYGSSPIQVEYEWSPTLYSLTDGEHDAFVLLEPAEYLSAEGETVYSVYGQYTDALSQTPVDAMFYFDADGNFLYAYAFPDTDENGASTPVEITPQTGDQFTDYVQFYTYDSNDEPIYEYELSDDVFTWGEEGFSFYSSYPVDGQYAVGIIAYDFDNNFVANFEFINYTR